MTKFFITHSWKDIEFARKLCDDLSAHNLDGFFDAYSIKPGDMVAAEIQRGLEACDVYVPILSYASLASPWCEEEINAAITLGKMPGRNGRPRIIPLLIENCQDKMPVFLHSRLYIVFANRYNEALRELLTKGFGISANTTSSNTIVPVIISDSQEVAESLAAIAGVYLPTRAGKDGKEMILIPAGEFLMGSSEDDNEKPPHKVYLDTFYIARYPVTNADYKKFVEAKKYSRRPDHWKNGKIPQSKEDHPVVNVTWQDAVAYCKWAGGRLPTEAEWEKAASWDDARREKRRYPWGKDFDKNKCNSSELGTGGTTPVGAYSAKGGDSPYGISDMAGNVWEWCSSLYREYPYRVDDGREYMQKSGDFRVLRGGSCDSDPGYARCAYRLRLGPDYHHNSLGFRIAESSPAVGSNS
jgi:formylglycine-generating enzyme required for sulfatase activity